MDNTVLEDLNILYYSHLYKGYLFILAPYGPSLPKHHFITPIIQGNYSYHSKYLGYGMSNIILSLVHLDHRVTFGHIIMIYLRLHFTPYK
jgi:hypothetical protein